jgi:hypothetical protein
MDVILKVLFWVLFFAAVFLYSWWYDPTAVKGRKAKKKQELAEGLVDKLNDKG